MFRILHIPTLEFVLQEVRIGAAPPYTYKHITFEHYSLEYITEALERRAICIEPYDDQKPFIISEKGLYIANSRRPKHEFMVVCVEDVL